MKQVQRSKTIVAALCEHGGHVVIVPRDAAGADICRAHIDPATALLLAQQLCDLVAEIHDGTPQAGHA